ncbi:O-antigen ligase family protein [Chachezhania antarctica]|uniref:O-antigen ligase family protein n=1 Tax=Chachezhania antarctica TaxID=2340860 RepID=UPI000EAEEC18|nr:O-antigen ligase family protein [Chachezhania antarctica]
MMTALPLNRSDRAGFILLMLFVASLFALSVPYLAMLFLFAGAGLYFGQVVISKKINKQAFCFALLLGYVTLWGLMSGGLVPSSFLDPAYFAGEGRIYVAYLPIFLIFALPTRLFTEQNILLLVKLIMALGIALSPLWATGHMEVLFGSHHANGYASSNMLIIFAALYAALRRKWLLAGLCMALLMFMFSNSRTSFIGLAAAFMIYYRRELLHPKYIIPAVIFIFAAGYLWSSISPFSYDRLMVVFKAETWNSIITQFAMASELSDPSTQQLDRVGREYNILTRINLWARALWFFEQSPILGIGSFRYNDYMPFLHQVIPGVAIVSSDYPAYTVATAHNSYFQVLAEGGLVGMAIYLMPWLYALYTFGQKRKPTPFARAITQIGSLSTLFLMFGALTGHLFASPSGTLWVVLLIGLALQHLRLCEQKTVAARQEEAGRAGAGAAPPVPAGYPA